MKKLSDTHRRRRLKLLAQRERLALADLLSELAEWDSEDGPLKSGFSSLFKYLIEELGFSEDAALYRARAARLVRRFPKALVMLRSGKLSLTALVILNPVLTRANAADLLEEAAGQPTLKVREIVARLRPQPDIRDHIQRLPPNSSVAAESRGDIRPLSPGRYHIGFTADAALVAKIHRLRERLWHTYPEGRLEDIIGVCLSDSLKKREPKPAAGQARTTDRKADARAIPAAVRREVLERDGGCCTFVGPDGHRCGERSGLELDHIVPVAAGGKSVPSNLRVLCFGHNQLRARETFGAAASRFLRH